MLENCLNNISVYGCSTIRGTKIYYYWNLIKPGSQSWYFLCLLYIYTFPLASFWFFVQWNDLGYKNPLQLAHFGGPRYQDFWDKSLGWFLGFQCNVNLAIYQNLSGGKSIYLPLTPSSLSLWNWPKVRTQTMKIFLLQNIT